MKRLIGLVVVVMVILGFSTHGYICQTRSYATEVKAEESKEMLLLKKDNLALRIQNLQLQLQMAPEYQGLIKELREVNEKLKAMEPKKEDSPKAEKEKK